MAINIEGWCKSLPSQPSIWDPSRLAPALECWRKHYYKTIRGLRRNGEPSVHLEWGKSYHACVEVFDHQGIQEALSLAFELSWDFELKQPKWGEWRDLWQCTDPEMRPHKNKPDVMVKNVPRCPYAKKPSFVPPECGHEVIKVRKWHNYHSKKTRANLLRAVAYYCDITSGVKPYKFPDGTPSTEIQIRLPLPLKSPDDTPYELLCNIDSIVEQNGNLIIRERKTTGLAKLDAGYWQQYELNPQIDSYDLAASVLYLDQKTGKYPKLLVEATRISSKGEIEIVRRVIYIPEERKEEWLRELQAVIFEAEQRAREVEIHGHKPEVVYRRNPTACHGMYGSCTFFPLCSSPSSEREEIIKADYHIERWDPLKAESFIEEEV